MMGLLWVTILLLATHVPYSLVDAKTEVSCGLPSPLNTTKVSELLRNYTEQVTNSSDSYKDGFSNITVLNLIEFAINTTGNTNLTKSKLDWHESCLDRFKFTLIQLALINDIIPDEFPGNDTMKDIADLLNSNATRTVVENLGRQLFILRNNMSVNVDKHLHFFIENAGFIEKKAMFIAILRYCFNFTDYEAVATFLGYNRDLLNVTLEQMAEYMFSSPKELRNLTLKNVVRSLLSIRNFLNNLHYFIERERKHWDGKTVKDLVSGNDTDVKILTKLKEKYHGFNLTFIQFLWQRRVELIYFDYRIDDLVKVTGENSIAINNFTITGLFEFLFRNSELIRLYTKSLKASKTMQGNILKHYKISSISDLKKHFHLTSAKLEKHTDIEFENLAIKFYIFRYVTSHLNTTFGELERLANLDNGSLENATVDDFPKLMSIIGVAQAVKTINESGTLKYLLDDHSKLKNLIVTLRNQIEMDRQPLAKNFHLLFHDYDLSYLIYHQYSLKPELLYNQTVFDFIVSINLKWDSFVKQFKLNDSYTVILLKLFKTYTFKQITRFFGIRMYTIFGWDFSDIVTKILYLQKNDINECLKAGKNSCSQRIQCVNLEIGSYFCKCPVDVNVDHDNYCKDVDECKQLEPKELGCSKNSHCENTYGSYRCVCNKGYAENSRGECKDVDECKRIFNKCNPLAECENLPGTYKCVCPAGQEFHPTLHYCRDINECQKERPCVNISNSICVNKLNGYDCRCNPGFDATYNGTGNSKVLLNCSDINECSQPILNRCHRHAICNNTIGSYNCKCKKDYVGDGRICRENRLVIDPTEFRLISIRRTTRVRPSIGFFYDGIVHSKIYISTNGLISIGKKYSRSTPRSCTRGLKNNILAPFWSNSFGGQVGYQQYLKEEEGSASVLARINEIVNQTTNLTSFEASWGLVVSWSGIMPKYCFFFFCWAYTDETNAFQAVLATNGSTSVVLFLYRDGGMNWYRRLRRSVFVGYATKSKCHDYSRSITGFIFNIDNELFVDPAGTRRRGVIVNVFTKEEAPEDKCMSWILKEPKDNEWQKTLPSCPCTRSSLDLSFDKFSEDNNRICYVYIKEENTKMCCYFKRGRWRRGALITSSSEGGRLLRYSPLTKESLYREYDEKPFKTCCVESKKFCADFSQYRPVDSCSPQPPPPCSCSFGFRNRFRRRRRLPWWLRSPRRAWFFGDPHITTLDGFKYSFNGLGDYVLLKTKDKGHILHGRTFRPPHKNGGLSNATVFSGFVMRNGENTTIQVLFSDSINGNLSILVYNSMHECNSFGIGNLQPAPGFYLKKSNETLIVLFASSGFTVEITPGIGLLQIAFSVPPDLAEKNTTGLLGKVNGEKSDDLTYPNGTALPTSSTDKEIFTFGQAWKVPDEEGLFVFENCSKQQVYFDGNFRPMFLSDFNETLINQSIKTLCNDNKQCILDVLLTGNEKLGKATLIFEKKEEEKRAAMDNQPPDISFTPEVANVTVGQNTTIIVTVEDPNNDTYTLTNSSSLPDGAVFDNTTGYLTWLPIGGQQNQSLKLEFVAIDSKGASQLRLVPIKFCDCQNGQECDFTNVLKSNPNKSFDEVGCNCSDRYSGDYCQTQDNPCEDEPCFDNVNCTAKPSPEFGYICGECPAGLVGNGEDCNDLDECRNSTTNNCHMNQECVNTIGTFRCECKPGYKIQSEGGNCTDVDECNVITGTNDCGANTTCTNTPGSFNCTCKDGFEGNPKKGCTDINECLQEGRCNHRCQNTEGSFRCNCLPGYEPIERKPGFFQCKDIDECEFSINNDCSQICENVPKSYRCSCNDGYKLDADNKTCSVNVSCSNDCEHECTVISGRQTCQCRRGYKLGANKKSCEDIDECLEANKTGCGYNCSNVDGSYICTCLPGYQLAANKRDCKDINECKKNKGGCEHKCKNTEGSRTCSCRRGFTLGADKQKCEDIDECKQDASICPYKGQKCKNRNGGFRCRCPPRESLDQRSEKRECKKSKRFRLKMRLRKYVRKLLVWSSTLEDEFSTEYETMASLVITSVNIFFRTNSKFKLSYFGCRVTGFAPGSIVANVSLDFDTNSTASSDTIDNELKSANGTIGDLGFDPATSSVTDINECNDPEANDCHQHATCTNEPGSFSCSCKSGYRGDGVSCVEDKDKSVEDKDKSDNTALIVGLCIGIALLIIIIVVIVLCCYKREKKGDLQVTDQESYRNGINSIQMDKVRSGEVYYNSSYKGRRGSNESMEGNYDVVPSYYDNPVIKKDVEAPM